ncbi:MAG: site-specific integrase [Syntrophobacteraceae bacterium]
MPYKETRNGKVIWIGQVQWKGVRRKQSFQTKREAVEWERQAKDELVNPPKQSATPTASLIEWATRYLEHSERFNKKVFSEKRCEFKRFLQHKLIGPHSLVTDFTPASALAYCQAQFKKRGGYVVNNKVIKNLAAGWNHGIKYMGFPAPNPFLVVEKFPMDAVQGHYVPPEDDFWKVFAQAQGQDRAILATFLHTAGRRGEVFGLRWEDVNFEAREIALKTRKTKDGSARKDWIPLTDELAAMLLEHRQRSEGEYVFTQSVGRHKGKPYTENRDFPQELCRIAKVKPFGCHGIRGLTATLLASEGVPMKAIQEILRHRKLATTERYIRSTGQARNALKTLEGRFKAAQRPQGPANPQCNPPRLPEITETGHGDFEMPFTLEMLDENIPHVIH